MASFAVGKTTWNLPVLAIVVGLTLLLINTAKSRAKAKADLVRHVPLAKIPKKSDDPSADSSPANDLS